MKIIIFLSYKPRITETFILNELDIFKKNRVDFLVYYERQSKFSKKQPKLKKYEEDFIYIPKLPRNIIKKLRYIIYLQLKTLFCYPCQYSKVLLWILTHYQRIYLRNFFRVTKVIPVIEKFRPDLFYSHYSGDPAALAFLAAEFFSKKYGFINHQVKLYPIPQLPHHLQTQFIIVGAKYIKDMYLDNYPKLNPEKIKIIPWGIDCKFFNKMKNIKKDKNIFMIISLSQLVEKKGLIYLLKACNILREKKINFQCLIVGDGPEGKKLQRYTKKYNLKKIIKFFPALPHSCRFKKILSSADLFVLPSIVDQEGEADIIPNVLLEAMAMRIPIVTTKVSGMSEVISEGINGFFVKEKNEVDLANRIIKVKELSKEKRGQIGQEARETVVKYFDKEKCGEKLIKFLKSQTCL